MVTPVSASERRRAMEALVDARLARSSGVPTHATGGGYGDGDPRVTCARRRAMEALVDDGLARSIGVSNF